MNTSIPFKSFTARLGQASSPPQNTLWYALPTFFKVVIRFKGNSWLYWFQEWRNAS